MHCFTLMFFFEIQISINYPTPSEFIENPSSIVQESWVIMQNRSKTFPKSSQMVCSHKKNKKRNNYEKSMKIRWLENFEMFFFPKIPPHPSEPAVCRAPSAAPPVTCASWRPQRGRSTCPSPWCWRMMFIFMRTGSVWAQQTFSEMIWNEASCASHEMKHHVLLCWEPKYNRRILSNFPSISHLPSEFWAAK